MSGEPFAPSPARRGLDELMRRYPHFDLVRAWIPGRDEHAPMNPWSPSPWLMVELGQAGEGPGNAYAVWAFAIWRSTGAVHTVGAAGDVSDDPILEPSGPNVVQGGGA